MAELGLEFEKEFILDNRAFMITLDNIMLQKVYNRRGNEVWVLKGHVRKWLWRDEFGGLLK